MSHLHLTWTSIPSYHMTYATVLGYVFEVHASPVPLFGPPESFTVMCRHLHVVDGPQRTKIGEYGSEGEGRLAAEAWLGEQLQALGLVHTPAPDLASSTAREHNIINGPTLGEQIQSMFPKLDQPGSLEHRLGTAVMAGLTFMEEVNPYISNDNVGLIAKNSAGENVFILYNKIKRLGVRIDKQEDFDAYKIMTGTVAALEKNEGAYVVVARAELQDQAKRVAKQYLAN